jgi:pimeloyl-ACP methyl ester carboxylesterase
MSTQPRITPRCGLLAILALAPLAGALTACGAGPPGDQDKIAKTSTTFLRALADGHTPTACAQLTRRARGQRCPQTLKARLARMNPHELREAADASVDIDVHGTTATTRLGEPRGARLRLIKVGANWRIDSGYTVGTPTTVGARPAAATIPDTPVGRQLRWALAQLNGGAGRLTVADARARFSPRFLSVLMPAPQLIGALRQTAERGPFALTGFAFPPTATKAVALVATKTGERLAVRLELDDARRAQIMRLEVTSAPAPIVKPARRYTGRFDIGRRKLFLRCSGSGSPTVVFSGGVSEDWAPLQNRVARFTRACSYDPSNGLWGQSDPAPTPRTANDIVADLHALLRAARVPGPYVLAGHSDGGLFAQLYAARHRAQVKGLVLIDAVSSQYHPRRIALYRKLLPPAQFNTWLRLARALAPAIVDPTQHDMQTSEAQMRAALAAHPLRPMPLFVLTHGHPDDPAARFVAADERLWRQLQDGLAALVPHSRHAIAKRSGHDIQDDQPQLVVKAIRDVVQAVRHPASWKTR